MMLLVYVFSLAVTACQSVSCNKVPFVTSGRLQQ
jgi:hypothetical protein